VLTNLVNALTAFEPIHPDGYSHAVLVLDDYHVIDALPIHAALTFLLENLPPHLHLVIASRADPPLPLARFRVRGMLTEVRAADLRFTPEEAATFLREIVGLDLSREELAALDERTEGWIAGLQLAALAMRERGDISSFIASFTGSSRFIIDYLTEEVLNRQSEEVRAFLLRTSILESMCAPLCDALAGAGTLAAEALSTDLNGPALPSGWSQRMLEDLEHANLFITALDDERVWYRYHHLFADVLRTYLRRERPDLVPILYRRAAEWCESEELVPEALRYALASGDRGLAARAVERGFETLLFNLGDFSTVRSWLAMLPQALITARPLLALAYATTNLITNDMPSVKSYLDMAEQRLDMRPDLAPEIQPRIDAVRGFLAVRYRDWQGAAGLLKGALETMAGDDPYRGLALYALGRLYLVGKARSNAGQALNEAVEFNRRNGYTMLAILSLNGVAAHQTLEGRLHDAAATCREGLLLAERQGLEMVATAVNLNTRLSLYHYEWDDLDSALRYALAARRIARALDFSALLTTIDDLIAQISHAQGDHDNARGALPGGEAHGHGTQGMNGPNAAAPATTPGTRGTHDNVLRPVMLVGARVRHRGTSEARPGEQPVSGDLRRAYELGLTANDEPVPQYEVEYLALARRLLEEPDGRVAGCRLLERLLALGEANGDIGSVIAALALQAIALASHGRQGEALGSLERALKLGEPGGYVRTFIDEGPPMEALLRMASKRGPAPRYVEKLLGHFRRNTAHTRIVQPLQPLQPGPPEPTLAGFVEPLTPRELEVLRLIAGGASNRDIAETLVVVIGTVKRHTNSLYGKLGVTSRTQAIARAHELHLV
jgi:LuxR family maltose regulon positive regulatory protein